MADIDKIKGNFYIYSNGEHVVLSGAKLHIFRTDGSLVACRNDLRHASRITFLSGRRLLLSHKQVFHMIDLSDGCDIWTAPYAKVDVDWADFAITPDETCAYTYDTRNGILHITRLNLRTHEVDSYDVPADVGATRGILCDADGTPCLLKTLYETIGGKQYSHNGVRIHDYDIMHRGSAVHWHSKWQFEGTRCALVFLDSTDQIVTNDLHLYTPSTGASIDLLENEPLWQRPHTLPSCCWMDLSGRYLCVQFLNTHVFLDIHQRCVAAQYAAGCKRGCLIGNEYWICADNKIRRKPFPAFEEAPPVKASGGAEEYYTNHSECW